MSYVIETWMPNRIIELAIQIDKENALKFIKEKDFDSLNKIVGGFENPLANIISHGHEMLKKIPSHYKCNSCDGFVSMANCTQNLCENCITKITN